MIPRLTRIVGSLAGVIVLYWTYALLAVPFIEPSVETKLKAEPTAAELIKAQKVREIQIKSLESWFVEGDWERTSPKVLETSQGILLVKQYENLGEGKVEIHPCTMILLPDGIEDEEERHQRAIILRAPEGALLQFDSPFDLKQAKIGKLIAGKLMGPVTIRSEQKEKGPQDDLLIHTRDVDLTEQKLWTPHPVDFQLGPNYGHGRSMQIDLAPQGSKIGYRGITMLQLTHDVEMHLHPSGGNDVFPGGNPTASVSTAPGPKRGPKTNTPVEIRCQGPFRFDFLKNVATFTDRVDVLRINPSGPSDQLTGQILSLYFETVGGPKSADKAPVNLQPVRMEATGNPVVVVAPSNKLNARGQLVDYQIKTGAATLRGEPEAVLNQEGREIHSHEIYVRPHPSGRLGEFMARGHGWVRGVMPDDAAQQYEARWTRRLHFRPHEQNHLLSVEGAAHVHVVSRGALEAEEIHFWLIDRVVPGAPVVAGTEPKRELIPDRLLAIGNVKIDSPQLSGAVGQLQTWFEHIALTAPPIRPPKVQAPPPDPLTGAPTAPPGLGRTLPQPTATLLAAPQPGQPTEVLPQPTAPVSAGPQTGPIAASSPQDVPASQSAPVAAVPDAPLQRFHIDAELLRVRVKMQGQVTQLSEAVAEHRVRFTETQTKLPDERPLVVVGDQLHVLLPQPEEGTVTVTGKPAFVEARSLTLTSGDIHLDRARNTLSTGGAGAMTFPLDRDLEGRPAKEPQLLEVTWQGQMHFDGLLARFDRNVQAKRGPQTLQTELMEVLLTRPIKFAAAPKEDQTRPDIDQLTCRRGVFLENRTFEGQRLLSIDHLHLVELVVHQASGDMHGLGPGRLNSVRLSKGGDPALPGGAGAKPMAAKPMAGMPGRPKQGGRDGLAYLGVRFQRTMTGNMRRRETTFENQVRSIYGPVNGWEEQLDPDNPAGWGEQGMLLTSDRLTVVEMPATMPDEHAYEMEAEGNTLVESATYTARSQRLTYSQTKDLLVLEGNGRSDAKLYRQQRVGAAASEVSARKIMFWPSTNRADVDGVNYLDMTNPPGGGK